MNDFFPSVLNCWCLEVACKTGMVVLSPDWRLQKASFFFPCGASAEQTTTSSGMMCCYLCRCFSTCRFKVRPGWNLTHPTTKSSNIDVIKIWWLQWQIAPRSDSARQDFFFFLQTKIQTFHSIFHEAYCLFSSRRPWITKHQTVVKPYFTPWS